MSIYLKSIFSFTKMFILFPISIGATSIAGDDCDANWDYETSGLTAYFADDSEADVGTIVSWFWEFGDGTVSTEQNPEHTYAAGGEYITCLTITTSDGCESEFCNDVDIDAAGDCQADFDWNEEDDLLVVFEDKSDDGGATITSWFWDFGDGTTSTDANPEHTYTTAGIYIACLTITTSDGCTNVLCDEVEIDGNGGGGGGTCEAFFEIVSNTVIDGGFSLVFDNQSTGGMAGGSTPYTWDFGDGSPLYESDEAEHIYLLPGTYMVCLTAGVEDDDCFDQYCIEITLTTGGTANFDITEYPAAKLFPNPASESVTIQFENSSNGTVELYDLYGQMVLKQNIESSQTTIKTAQLTPGTFMAVIKTDQTVYTQQIIVQH